MAEANVPAAGALDDPEAMYRGWGVPDAVPGRSQPAHMTDNAGKMYRVPSRQARST